MSDIITVSNLIKTYRKAKENAVDNISFVVKEGEFFCLLGPNGAGKTTTISILTTTLQKSGGTVTIAGHDLDKNQTAIRKSVGIIFQKPSLDQNLSAEENIRLHAVLYGMYPFRPFFGMMAESYKKRVYELSEVLGIQDDLFKPIKTFSGGMKRKLEILRSLMHHPKVLFLDEPTVGLDPISRKNLWEYLTNVRKNQKTTVFLTTHYLEEAEEANHICIIQKGKIVSFGTPEKIKAELIEEYLLVDAKNRDELKKELTKQNLEFQDGTPIKVYIKSNMSAQKVIHVIKTPLTLLKTHTPTLEEAYVEIVERKDLENGGTALYE